MEGILYCTLNIFCISILILILVQIIRSADKRISQRMYFCFIIASIILCTSDLAWGIIDYFYTWRFSDSVDFVVNSIYHIFTVVVSYLWFLFSESEQETRTIKTKTGGIISLLPLITDVIFIASSYWNNGVFFVTGEGVYQRGPMYIAHIVICLFYISLTSMKALLRSFYKKNYVKRDEYRTLAFFCIYPLIAGVAQVCLVGSPMISAAVAFAALQVYMRSRERLISVDPLTKLNNRAEMERFLDNKMKNRNTNRDLYLFIMDLDYFKKINDKYGHVEGDIALVIVSDALKNAVRKTNFFACRYGGDEFVVVGEVKSNFDADEFCRTINEKLEEETSKYNKEYKLEMSIGYFKYSPEINSIYDFISAADRYLYKQKNERNSVVSASKD